MRFEKELAARIVRQQAFHQSKEPGDLLVYVNRWRDVSLEGFLCRELFHNSPSFVMSPKYVDTMIESYVSQKRAAQKSFYEIDDDCVPSGPVFYAGIGAISAAMTGLEPTHDETTSWLEPNLPWNEIDQLRFNPDNKWVQFALEVNRALWRRWDGDFLILPFLHRSPLDAANGLRGTDLFEEMHTEPDRVKRLVEWCADWSIEMERFLADNSGVCAPKGWGTAVWDTWLPDGAVFVNGDPVGLISREMMTVFEQPYTSKLFKARGGGFFHNHTVGLYQVDQVARTPGLLVQEFIVDPKKPNLPEVLLNDAAMRETILSASLESPIMIECVNPSDLDRLIPILKRGRFILGVTCQNGVEPNAVAREVRSESNLS